MSDLDQRLLEAHARQDHAALVTLYSEAAEMSEDEDSRGFYLTHAYIFALELGHPAASTLHGKLKATGREE
ncbi:hypothetical protein [Planktotalea sp.]|uniref:hypothetical protein n=1 Tax=Planktotalea sp. TaxID=2029877 RepID=UPI003D6C2CE2